MTVLLFAAGATLLVLGRWSHSRTAVHPAPDQLLTQAEAGSEAAVRALIAALGDRWDAQREATVARMLQSNQALVRAAACTTIGRAPLNQFSAAIWPRLSDDDWRVRAAGFEALRDLGGERLHFTQPLRDTPVEEREQIILDVMAQWRASSVALPALPQLCELYPTLDHWLSGTKLTESCLSCHAPSKRTYEASASCMSCHAQIHATWAASAHSRSVSHLPLARVDTVTKQVVLWNYGTREGLDCMSCHREASATTPDSRISPVQAPLPVSVHRFDRSAPASASCAACHVETQEQWQTWRTHPRPRMASWPPDTIEFVSQAPAQSCADCHMQKSSLFSDPSSPHGFVTRRNPQFLRDGLIVRIEPATKDSATRLVLANLTGHAYPAGTHRRSLRIELQYDDDPSTRTLLARLKHKDAVPTTQPCGDVLAPGEQRVIELPLKRDASSVTCDVTYERNGYVDQGYEVPLASVTQQLRR